MSQAIILLDALSKTLFYGTSNIVFTAATKRIQCTGIGLAVAAGDTIIISLSENVGENDGTKTVATIVSDDIITIAEAVVGNADDDTAVILGEWTSPWHRVDCYSRLSGPVVCDQDASLRTDWAPEGAVTRMSTALTAVTGGTTLSHAAEVIAPYVRFRIRNNDTASGVLSGALYAKALT